MLCIYSANAYASRWTSSPRLLLSKISKRHLGGSKKVISQTVKKKKKEGKVVLGATVIGIIPYTGLTRLT